MKKIFKRRNDLADTHSFVLGSFFFISPGNGSQWLKLEQPVGENQENHKEFNPVTPNQLHVSTAYSRSHNYVRKINFDFSLNHCDLGFLLHADELNLNWYAWIETFNKNKIPSMEMKITQFTKFRKVIIADVKVMRMKLGMGM